MQDKVLMKFEAAWCMPCKQLSLNLDKLNPDIEIQVFDADEHTETFAEFKVRSVPTLILMKDGEEVKRSTGMLSTEALKMFLES